MCDNEYLLQRKPLLENPGQPYNDLCKEIFLNWVSNTSGLPRPEEVSPRPEEVSWYCRGSLNIANVVGRQLEKEIKREHLNNSSSPCLFIVRTIGRSCNERSDENSSRYTVFTYEYAAARKVVVNVYADQ